MRTMNIKTETKTYEISYENLEAAIVQFLQSNRIIPFEWDILELDIALPLNEKGNVEFDLTAAIPEDKRKPNLKVISNDTPTQLTLFNV